MHLDNTSYFSYKARILRFILALPKRLRHSQLSKPPQLCSVHHLINPEVASDILHLIQREITVHFHPFDTHPEHIPPAEKKILANLRALKGMWTLPNTKPPGAGAWRYQINQCPGCMLARISSNKKTLRDLRIVLWSRTDDYNKYSLYRMIAFVDDCIGQFGHDEAEQIFSTVNIVARSMRVIRHACLGDSTRVPDQHENYRRDPFPGQAELEQLEPSPTSQLHRLQPEATRSGIQWGNIPEQLDDMIGLYRGLGWDQYEMNKVVLEEIVDPLDLSKKRPRSNEIFKRDGIVGCPENFNHQELENCTDEPDKDALAVECHQSWYRE
ncbi:hypothetical protein N7490_005839 [Penicillium lividum]|nr:hypothetical protein N7490_005839 [Penicillium lividum]